MKKSTEKIVAYIFGVVFVIVILIIAVQFPNPSSFQYLVFRIVLALAAAGVASMIPGFINVNVGTAVRAGGAIAVFVIVYFFSPAQLAVNPPNTNAMAFTLGEDVAATRYVTTQVTEGNPEEIEAYKQQSLERLSVIQSKADQLDLHIDLRKVFDTSQSKNNLFPDTEVGFVREAIHNVHGKETAKAFESGWLIAWLYLQGATVFDDEAIKKHPEYSQQFIEIYPKEASALNKMLSELGFKVALSVKFESKDKLLNDCQTIKQTIEEAWNISG